MPAGNLFVRDMFAARKRHTSILVVAPSAVPLARDPRAY